MSSFCFITCFLVGVFVLAECDTSSTTISNSESILKEIKNLQKRIKILEFENESSRKQKESDNLLIRSYEADLSRMREENSFIKGFLVQAFPEKMLSFVHSGNCSDGPLCDEMSKYSRISRRQTRTIPTSEIQIQVVVTSGGFRNGVLSNVNELTGKTSPTPVETSQHAPVPGYETFSAQLSNDINNIYNGHSIVFDNIVSRSGSGYDETSGVFTCQFEGQYFFTWTVCGKPGVVVDTYLYQNSDGVAATNSDSDGSTYSSGTGSAVLYLHRGDRVKVMVYVDSQADAPSILKVYSSFSGFLIP